MNTLEKVNALRKNIHLRAKTPENVFTNRIRTASSILKKMEKSTSPETEKREFRRLYIVTLVAAFESFWREFVKSLANYYGASYRNITFSKKVNFTITEAMQIVEQKITLGELLSALYNFQSLEGINLAFSDILGEKDLLSKYSKVKYKITEVLSKRKIALGVKPSEQVVSAKEFLSSWIPDIKKAISIRHDTVHDTGLKHRLREFDVLKIETSMLMFSLYFARHIEERSERKLKKR